MKNFLPYYKNKSISIFLHLDSTTSGIENAVIDTLEENSKSISGENHYVTFSFNNINLLTKELVYQSLEEDSEAISFILVFSKNIENLNRVLKETRQNKLIKKYQPVFAYDFNFSTLERVNLLDNGYDRIIDHPFLLPIFHAHICAFLRRFLVYK